MATCFFLDCAHNIVDFIEIIHRILKVRCLSIGAVPIIMLLTDSSHIIHRILKVRCLGIGAVQISMLSTDSSQNKES